MELKKRVETLYQNLYFKPIKEKKIITMLKSIVIDKETDISIIAKNSSTTEKVISKYINSKELLLPYLNEDEYKEFLSFRDTINSKEKQTKDKEKYNLYKNLINDINNTRLKTEDICKKNNIVVSTYEEMLEDEDYLIDHFGKDIINQIKFRISETSIIRNSVPKDKLIIEYSSDLEVVKDQIHYLDSYELKMLNVVSDYIINQADISFVTKKNKMPEEMVYNYIMDSKVKDIIKESYYKKLKKCIEKENILKSDDLNLKRDLIEQSVLTLKECNYNIDKTKDKMNILKNLLIRILKEDLIVVLYKEDEIEKINDVIRKTEEVKK